MANLKEIRNRIASVSSTMKITSAMKMVSAAKLKKAQDAITAMRPYSEKLTELLQALGESLDDGAESVYGQERELRKVLLVAISSNRGLCGAFNANIVKRVTALEAEHAGAEVSVMAIGKKAGEILAKKTEVVSTHNEVYDDLTFARVEALAERIMGDFASGEYDKVVLVYNRFKNAATQVVMAEPFLPIRPVGEGKASSKNEDYLYEPTQVEIVETLIPKSLKTQLFKAIRDSVASEHGARMTAMHKATDNAKELRSELKLHYNKARQAAITGEILEIVGGAEALNG